MRTSLALRRRLAGLRALVVDCDGVLTDGRLYYGADGIALKAFDVKDGQGLATLREAGVRLAILSADRADLLDRRAEKLGIAEVHQGVSDKAAALRDFAARAALGLGQVGYAGDDVNDLKAIRLAGVSFAPSDASPVVRRAVDVVTVAAGGRGAVREMCDLLMSLGRTGARKS